ncbi:PaaI family thioesterase [Roseitranquillus sediminis]|uniref:PaaI family thioesterase n=1 Tax=Roseitranquillus sediminis TaxID=2809051 RepID=UPI001D0C0868|nr:PaaI family thioesterase [Roseitranquillus sediminis]MBM9595474.1 PaaI family thioesterase [Roseitranquillus sediminis]
MTDAAHKSESPFLDLLGTRVEEWRDGFARISLEVQPHHLNRAGVVHGGVLATLLDHGAGFCGLYCTVPGNRRYGVTLSLTCNFVAQTRAGVLTVTGRRKFAGRKIYFADTEVHSEDGTLVASGTSVHRFRSGSEAPEGVAPKAPGGAAG